MATAYKGLLGIDPATAITYQPIVAYTESGHTDTPLSGHDESHIDGWGQAWNDRIFGKYAKQIVEVGYKDNLDLVAKASLLKFRKGLYSDFYYVDSGYHDHIDTGYWDKGPTAGKKASNLDRIVALVKLKAGHMDHADHNNTYSASSDIFGSKIRKFYTDGGTYSDWESDYWAVYSEY